MPSTPRRSHGRGSDAEDPLLRPVAHSDVPTNASRHTDAALAATFEEAPIGIAHAAPDGHFQRVNRRLCGILGYAVGELDGRSLQDVTLPGEVESLNAALARVLAGRLHTYEREQRCRRKDGTAVWVHLSLATARGKDGDPLFLIATLEDVTHRRQAEEALRTSQERLRVALLAGQMSTWDVRLEADGVAVQQRAAGVRRRSDHDSLEASFDAYVRDIHPQDRSHVLDTLRAAIQDGCEYSLEHRVIRSGGVVGWVEVRGRVVRDTGHGPVHLTGVYLDITERKVAQLHAAARQRVAEIMATCVDLDEAAPRLLQAIAEPLGWQYAELWRLRERGQTLRCIASWAAPPLTFTAMQAFKTTARFRRGKGLPGRTWESEEVQWIPNLGSDLHLANLQAVETERLYSAAAFPVRLQQKVLGVITLFSQEFRDREAAVIELVASLGSQIGQFMERARVEQRLRDETRIIEALHRFGTMVTSQLELPRVLQAAAEEAVALTEAQFGAFFGASVSGEAAFPLLAVAGAPPQAFEGSARPRRTPMLDATFEEHRVVRVDDVTIDPRFTGLPANHLRVRSYLAVPVVLRSGDAAGALLLGHSEPGVFTERDERFARGIAAWTAVAVDNARLYQQEREAQHQLARRLHHERDLMGRLAQSFLGDPAEIPGLDIAARYVPAYAAERMGGDYYDFIRLPDDRVALVIGDVCGKGLNAGVYTAMVKYYLRAYAREEPSPARLFERLNHTLWLDMRRETVFVTLLFAVLDRRQRTVTWANAAHPAPVLYDPGTQICARLEVTGGVAGGIPDLEFTERTLHLPAAAVLVLFTDGVSEAAGQLDPDGDGGISRVLMETDGATVQGIATAVIEHARRAAGGRLKDDVALVVVRP